MPEAAEAVEAEQVEETAAESEERVEAEADDAAPEDADGEVSEPSEDDSAAGSVKYTRFKNVHERMKTAEAKAAELQKQLDALKPKEEPKAEPSTAERLKRHLKPAPKELPVLEQMEYYTLETIQAHLPEILESWFEGKFGMKPEAAGATLSHATVSTRDTIRKQWETAASARGLDPKSEQLREAVGNLMSSGKYSSFDEALDLFSPRKKPAAPARITGKGAEVDSVDLTGLSKIRVLPRNKDEAMRLASENKRIEPVDITEILAAMQDKS